MKPAAIGVRMHSGWGALVVLSNGSDSLELIDRRRMDVTAVGTTGIKQPYHFAKNLSPEDAGKFIGNCFAASEKLAKEALSKLIADLAVQRYCVVGAAILRASGRPLPALPNILASHALIHTAEGEFFRATVSQACEELGLAVSGFRERDLDSCVQAALGKRASRTLRHIGTLGCAIGPPWTKDQKSASLAALLVLTSHRQRPRNGAQ